MPPSHVDRVQIFSLYTDPIAHNNNNNKFKNINNSLGLDLTLAGKAYVLLRITIVKSKYSHELTAEFFQIKHDQSDFFFS